MRTTAIGFFILVLGGILFSTPTTVYCDGHFVLERISSMNMKHSEVIARDQARHDHHRRSINFPLQGGSSIGLYFTRVKIGNPPKEYHLVIDTGSDVTWVNCISCIGCPNTSAVTQLRFYDPHTSSSAKPLSCLGHCRLLPYTMFSTCPFNPWCKYSIYYEDENQASGHYVLDAFHFDTMMANSTRVSTSANVVFGCTNYRYGTLTNPNSALDGILGLAPRQLSLISQLNSRGIVLNVFSHCLHGECKGGAGILVLGEIVGPSIIYTPLVPNQTHYNVNLLGISINGKTLPIDPLVFSVSRNQYGTVVDSGTTYAYLPAGAYDQFISAIAAVVPQSVSSFSLPGLHCFQVSNSVRDVFPLVSLDFAGGASMVLKPEEYLLKNGPNGAPGVWCIGFQKSQGLTILGDLVLKNKIIVYDLALQRLGWAEYDCSSFINVSSVPPRVSSSPRDAILHQFLTEGKADITMLGTLVASSSRECQNAHTVSDVREERSSQILVNSNSFDVLSNAETEDHQVMIIQQGSLPSTSDEQAMSSEFESDISLNEIVEALSSIGSDKALG